MPDYVPGSDALFSEFSSNFGVKLALHQALLGISVGQVAEHGTLDTEWGTRRATYLAALDTLAAALAAKRLARENLEAFLRVISQFMQGNPAMTDELREDFRITVPDRERTEVPADLVLSIEAPSIHIEWGARDQATLHHGHVPTNENENAKPDGIHSTRIEFCVGGIPVDDSEWKLLVEDTHSPYIHVLGEDAPTKVAYRAQWVDTKERRGPYGESVDVTISD